MANHFNIPFLNPFKFVKRAIAPGIHFDDAWACEQIMYYEMNVRYIQKWKRSETTKIQVESSIMPSDLKVYTPAGVVVGTIPWTLVFSAISYGVYEATIDFSGLPEGKYFLYGQVNLLSVNYEVWSHPIYSRNAWPNTVGIRYYHSFNDFDVAFTTGIQFLFRIEGGIPASETEFLRNPTEYVNQTHNVVLLNGVPSRLHKFLIGLAPGVAPYMLDILNRIFDCDHVYINDKRYAANPGAELKTTRIKGYPLVGAELEIVESENAGSLQFSDTEPLAPGIVTAYDIDTSVFGPGALVPITDVEEH